MNTEQKRNVTKNLLSGNRNLGLKKKLLFLKNLIYLCVGDHKQYFLNSLFFYSDVVLFGGR